MQQTLKRLTDPLRATAPWQLIEAERAQRVAARSWRGDADEVVAYHEAHGETRSVRESRDVVSDRTWADLEMDAIFARVDSCDSPLGQQMLYDMLRSPLAEPRAIRARDQLIREVAERPGAQQRIRDASRMAATSAAYELHRLIDDGTGENLPERPRWWPLLPLLTALSLLSFLVLWLNPKAGALLLLAVIAANVGITVYYRPRVHHLLRSVSALPNLLDAARALLELDLPCFEPELQNLRRDVKRLRWIRTPTRHLQKERGTDPVSETVAGYINLLFLADVNAFVFSINRVREHQAELRHAIETVGLLDAINAVVAFRSALTAWCTPEFTQTGSTSSVEGIGIHHPILDAPVPNDFVAESDAPWLITGSNMAGKTTFLRAAGACVLLGRTLATCPAHAWRSPVLDVHTLINRRDDMLQGRSYFLVEAEYVREMIDAARGVRPCLFLIDELFRGTNTPERLAAAHAVLTGLQAPPHVCVVSTHDVELVDLLGERWRSWHFEERADGDGTRFDYRLQHGAATHGNALRVLESVGYPPDVLTTARATFARLTRARDL